MFKHILFYFINTCPIELKLSEFECRCKRKAGTDFHVFLMGISHDAAAILDMCVEICQ